MADNVTANAGTGGSAFATDDIGGIHYQRTKVTWGPDGTANDTDVAANKALPVQLRDTAGAAIVPATAALQGALTETAPASDTASSGLNGRLQRIAQRLTSLIALLPTALGANGGLKIEGVASGTVVPVSLVEDPSTYVSGCITSAMTGTTSTSLLAAPGASLRNYITQITISCAHATQGTDVLIQDGSGGTTLYVIPAAALYGGASVTFPVPLRQPTTNTALFCANVTTGSSTKASCSGYKSA